METKSGRSSKVSDRSTPSSRISRPGSAVDLILKRIGAVQKNLGAIHTDIRNSIEAIHADLGAVHANLGTPARYTQTWVLSMQTCRPTCIGAVQVETREVLETVIHRLERLEAKVCCMVGFEPQSF